MSNAKLLLQNRVHEIEQKLNHVLLTAAGAGIGFAFTQVKELSITLENIPIIAAVIIWGLSFLFGIRCHQVLIGYTRQNIELVDTLAVAATSDHSEIKRVVTPIMQERLDRWQMFEKLQLGLFIAGAISLFFWYILRGLDAPCLSTPLF